MSEDEHAPDASGEGLQHHPFPSPMLWGSNPGLPAPREDSDEIGFGLPGGQGPVMGASSHELSDGLEPEMARCVILALALDLAIGHVG